MLKDVASKFRRWAKRRRQNKRARHMRILFQTLRRLRKKWALTPEQAERIQFPCC